VAPEIDISPATRVDGARTSLALVAVVVAGFAPFVFDRVAYEAEVERAFRQLL